MRVSFRLASVVVVACASGAAVALAACGDDTVQVLPADGGSDATVDASYDGAFESSTVREAGEAGEEASCTPVDAGTLDEASVAAGGALVTAYKCAHCHGTQLAGNATGVQSSQDEGGVAYPPNLTPDPASGLGCWTNAQIANAVLNGVDDLGDPLCPPMPHFADAGLDASGVDDLVAYLRSLSPVYMTVPDTVCSAAPAPEAGADGAAEAGPTEGGASEGGSDAAAGDDADAAGE